MQLQKILNFFLPKNFRKLLNTSKFSKKKYLQTVRNKKQRKDLKRIIRS